MILYSGYFSLHFVVYEIIGLEQISSVGENIKKKKIKTLLAKKEERWRERERESDGVYNMYLYLKSEEKKRFVKNSTVENSC